MSRFVRASKYRHVFGKAEKPENCYLDVKLSRNAWDQNYVDGNLKYFAVAWESGGGACAVIPYEQTGKLPAGNVPLVSGHKGPVLDLAWNNFSDDLLATVSEDCYGRIWQIPEGGLTENLEEPVQLLKGHKRKVGTVMWHPTASNLIATSSADFSVKIWDVETGDCVLDCGGASDLIQSTCWNQNGSLIATTCKDKKIRICDPRKQEIAAEGQGHLGIKGSRCTWLYAQDKLFTVGFTRTSEREYAIWDPRDLAKPVVKTGVDSASGILMPFYDEDTNMLYLAGKGDGNIRYYEIVDDSKQIYFLSEYKSAKPQRGMNFLPKRACDVSKCEVARALKVDPTSVEPISFTVPRKSDLFQDDIFPPAYAGEAVLTKEQWLGGEDADPKRVSLEGGFVAPEKTETTFTKVEAEKELTGDELKKEYEALKKKVAYLEAELIKRDVQIKELSS